MPAVLLSVLTSRWFWYLIGAVALVTAIWVGVAKFNHMREQAALVPGLQAKVASQQLELARDDSRASKAAIEIVAARAAHDQAVLDWQKWDGMKRDLDKTLEDMNRHAPAATATICLPTAAQRQLWNDFIARLTTNTGTRPAGASGAVPAGPVGVH